MPADEQTAAPRADDAPAVDEPLVVVVMGVSGSGKTTVGRVLANRLGWPFFEGDDLHPESNVKKMKAGEPLADHDRQPWLEEIRDLAARLIDEGRSGVVACSALKQAYRDLIRGDADAVCFAYLSGDREQIAARLEERDGHYMPASLLDSQFEALEEPGPDEEYVFEVGIKGSPEATARKVIEHLVD